jgi:hypothetical protein
LDNLERWVFHNRTHVLSGRQSHSRGFKYLDIASALPCLDPGLYSTVTSNAERISTHLAILPLGSLRLKIDDENIWTIWKDGYSITELMSFQENDEDIDPLMQWKIDGARPLRSEIEKNSPATRHCWFLWDSLLLQNGLLFKEYILIAPQISHC